MMACTVNDIRHEPKNDHYSGAYSQSNMGHDIYGFKNKKELDKFDINNDEVCYLRRNMWSQTVSKVYEALGVSDFDNSVSGSGEDKEFTLEQLQKAYNTISEDKSLDEEDKTDYCDFLECVIKRTEANKEKTAIIYFG